MKKVAVFGLAITGQAVARALVQKGISVVMSDDNITSEHHDLSTELGCSLLPASHAEEVKSFFDGVDTLVPAPGVPPRHPVIRAAQSASIRIRTEIDIAYEWEMSRPGGPRPIIGVTGTDGKTTTTMLAAHILRESGLSVAEVGNTDVPFMAAQGGASEAFVVECSSFRLNFTDVFRCNSSVWLNLAPDHLDWHDSFNDYVAAKTRMWAFATSDDVAVVPYGQNTISQAAQNSKARMVTFGISDGDYRVANGTLLTPHGELCEVGQLWRSMPHDITNSLAASAVVLEAGLASTQHVANALQSFVSAHHRIELVGEFNGSSWFDDSKATSPHAALTAIRAFDSLVLIAGGRNKGLDLVQMATEPHRMVGVVAIGDDASLIEEAFAGVCPVVRATNMGDAVRSAAGMALPGVAVVLSPGCTSYDWYRNYNERGDHFVQEVREYFRVGEQS